VIHRRCIQLSSFPSPFEWCLSGNFLRETQEPALQCDHRMHLRIWPTVGLSFLILLSLVPCFAWLIDRENSQLDRRTAAAQQNYQQATAAAGAIRTELYRLELSPATLPTTELESLRRETDGHLNRLQQSLDKSQKHNLTALETGLNSYFDAMKQGEGNLPEVLELISKMDSFNEANLAAEQRQVDLQQKSLRHFSQLATAVVVLLGVFIALISTVYFRRLESASQRERVRAETAEYELRRLSNQLVKVQEEERKSISRELHDEIGQMLTGLRMELGSLSRAAGSPAFEERLSSAKKLAEESLRSIRNLALLLRPSMLDDLGLEPALRWQAKEFSLLSGTPATVEVQGQLDGLPEAIRICLYRVIQEALTNCMKYASATRVTIAIGHEIDLVTASVTDNGKGFQQNRRAGPGLGLVGMEERVRALQGRLTISSEVGRGTTIQLSLPVIPALS
jgi:signal transduction histidine kinase